MKTLDGNNGAIENTTGVIANNNMILGTTIKAVEEELKALQGESILVAQSIRGEGKKEALTALSVLLRTTPTVLRNIYGVQKQSGAQHGLDIESFASLEVLGEEIAEAIVIEDWLLLSDILEFEYVALIERWLVAVENLKEEIL